ncbi:phage tail sheath family protein [Bradyrhizobium sp.]|jgi:phage tail sheath protein FI|uniref:phage tail sheath family protein n=1 Tax=Bradyrhizobium sp. TaxID=376 RepID=UPI002E0C3361|nr:phage tail sheath C-terminal domain-containing protein [Bradyrhizobium sp.]
MTPLSPGVYVLEVPGGPRAIEGALTAVTIFVGETERGPLQPTAVRSRLDYERIFGGYFRHRIVDADAVTGGASDLSKLFMPYAMDGFFGNGGPRAYVLRTTDDPGGGVVPTAGAEFSDGTNTIHIDAASPGAWGNFISVTVRDSSDGDATRFAIVVSYRAPGEGAAAEVEVFEALSIDPADEKYCVDMLVRSGFIRWRTGDVASARLGSATQDLAGGDGGQGSIAAGDYGSFLTALREIDDAALIVAASDKMLPGGASADEYITISNDFVDYVSNERPQLDLFFVGDLPRFASESDPAAAVVARARGTVAPGSTPSNFCAIYWPHIVVSDPVGQGANPRIVLPPAGHIAGLYGSNDGRRGVWKAPAGVEVRVAGALMLDFKVLDVHQDVFNPLGVNALRAIPNAGNVIWGTRTREPTSQWRYIPVRRTAMFLRKSIFNGIQWAVFEPNDQPLWTSLRATIGAFMETQFRNGAFAGATSRDAYFVKCDADTTTEADQVQGIVNVLVGFAPLRPAEFVIVKLSQKTRQAA